MKKILLGIGIVLLASLGVYTVATHKYTSEPAKTATVTSVKATAPTVSELLELVNAERAKVGVKPLVEDSRLDQSAQFKADEMSATNMLAHTNKDGVHGYTYIARFGKKCVTGSENLYWNGNLNARAEQAIAGWYRSPKHKEAMLDPKYDSTGIGVSRFIDGYIAVEHFCDE